MKTTIPKEVLEKLKNIARDEAAGYNDLTAAVCEFTNSLDGRKGLVEVFKSFTGLKVGQIIVRECNENEVQREQWEYQVWDAPDWVGELHAGAHGRVKQRSGRWNARQRAVDAAMKDLIVRKVETEVAL